MAMAAALRAEFGEALRKKLERRFRRATQRGATGAAAYDPKAAMDVLVRMLAAELEAEEQRRREAGQAEAADTFSAIRHELLGEVAAGVLAANQSA